MTIAALNSHLEGMELALPNMGGFDGQTVAGVISTSTHGSGFEFGPLSDLVRSLDIVGSGGRVYRVERADGPTDQDSYAARYPDRELVQDDRWFRAVVVGMGCMGLIHSVMIEVVPLYYLREVRSMSTWSKVRTELESDQAPKGKVHYEVLFNPYPGEDGEIECLITTRTPVDRSEFRRDRRRSRSLLMELAARFPLTPVLINLALGLWPKIAPFMIAQALKALVNEDYVNISYKVLNIGAALDVNGLDRFQGLRVPHYDGLTAREPVSGFRVDYNAVRCGVGDFARRLQRVQIKNGDPTKALAWNV